MVCYDKWKSNKKVIVSNDRAILIGASGYTELVLNPKYYYYFMGIKVLRLNYDLIFRFRRGRPAQITDLLVVRHMYNLNYDIKIPKSTTIYNTEKNTTISTPINEKRFIDTIRHYLSKRYYISLSSKQVYEWIYRKYQNNHQDGGNNIFTKQKNIANKSKVYPSQKKLIKMG